MKRSTCSIAIVGPHSTLVQNIGNEFANTDVKIALISWNKYPCEIPYENSPESFSKRLINNGVSACNFTGDLTKQKDWEDIVKQTSNFLDEKLDLLLYFDGLYYYSSLENSTIDIANKTMQINFEAPVLAVTSFLPLLTKSRGRVALMANISAGIGFPNTTFYNSSKRALEAYLQNISKQTGLKVTYIYPGIEEAMKINNNTQQYVQQTFEASYIKTIYTAINEVKDSVIFAERSSTSCPYPFIIPTVPRLHVKSSNSLSQAIFSTDISQVKQILKGYKSNPDMLYERDEHGRNPFHYVANSGSIAIYELLFSKLRKKSALNDGDNYGWTPLHFAANNGHLRMIKSLIRNSCDPNCLTKYNESVLHFLAKLHPNAEDGKQLTAYSSAIKACIDVGGDVNQRNCDWYTPVHAAAFSGSIIALQLFLKYEGDPHRKTKTHQQTPLSYAVRYGTKEVVKYLLKEGADPIACFDFATPDLQPLLEKYREVNCRPDSGTSDRKKEIVVIKTYDDFPSSTKKIIESSGLLSKQELIDQHYLTYLYVLRFLTRKIYKTPEQIAENPDPEPPRVFCSRTKNNRTIDEATSALVTNGNPRKMFKIIEDVGAGGFGSVVKVRRLEDKKFVAIKKVPHLTEKEMWSNLDEIHFLTECKHSCVVRYYNSYLTRDEMWMVMEFLEGGSLSLAVSKFQLQESQICYVTKEILRGLSYIHSKNIAHRDLKSANIMLSIHGDIKIIDFGLCVELGSVETTNMVGSPFWIPPEMVRKEEHGTAADIWSLAILCLEMAHGRPPNRRSALKAMFYSGAGIIPKLVDAEKMEPWSDNFRDFLSKMLVSNPNERSTADELLKHPWMEQAATRDGMSQILHHIFVENSLKESLGL